jgi:hypothetical protein
VDALRFRFARLCVLSAFTLTSLIVCHLVHPQVGLADVCYASGLRAYPVVGHDVEFPGRGDCATDVKGIRVHVNGWRKNLDYTNYVKVVDDATVTCGGISSPTIIERCPQVAFWFTPKGNRASGCKYYWSRVWIDVVYGGNANWSLNQHSVNPGTVLICYNDPP